MNFARIEQRQDVWVVELSRDLDLTQEPLGAQGGCQLGFEDLEGDVPAMRRYARLASRPRTVKIPIHNVRSPR